MNPSSSFRSFIAAFVLALFCGPSAFADPSDLLFTLRINNNTNTPTFTLTNNSPNLSIDRFDFTIGNTAYGFDAGDHTLTPSTGASLITPTGAVRQDKFQVNFAQANRIAPGESFQIRIDIDTDGQNDVVYSNSVFFNNGNAPNSVATVHAGPVSAAITLEDNAPTPYVFRGPSRRLTVVSKTETATGTDSEFVRGITLVRNGVEREVTPQEGDNGNFTVNVSHGDRVQITAPQEVFKDINANYLTSSNEIDPDLIRNEAEERFVAIGMSVNDIAQTADPTNYDFEITGDTDIQVKWRHYYALTIRHDFSKTRSQEVIAGTPWAGPLESDATGNPSPPVSKQWVVRGSQPVVQVDGQFVDSFSHPGLDIRHVVKGYRAYGPPNSSLTIEKNSDRLGPAGVDIRKMPEGTVGSYSTTGTATQVTTAPPTPVLEHGMQNLDKVVISGSSHPAYNAEHTVTRLSSSTFSIPIVFPGTVPTTRGTWAQSGGGSGTIATYAAFEGGATLVTIAPGPAPGPLPHGMKNGDRVEISGSGHAAYNGIFPVIRISDTAFSIPVPPAAAQPVAKGIWKNVTYVGTFNFPTVEARQQVKPDFSMYGPGGITYVWQIQYGVRLAADDVSRTGLAKVYQVVTPTQVEDRTVQDGVAWFDPGSRIRVVSAAREPVPDGLALTGWVNGDGYFFSSQGQIDPASGLPTSGGPVIAGGSPVATWISNSPEGMRGYEIGSLQRPVRTLWRYGAGAIVVNVDIGKHLFEDYPNYAQMFIRPPEPITNAIPDPAIITPGATAPSPDLMAEWDPVSARLFPTIPGRFTVPWKPGLDGLNPVEVRVIAKLPFDGERQIRGHYPHIHGTPAVALDPDPNDDFSFRSVKYTTAGASVDGNKRFLTERPGISVLLFSQIQRSGRGESREVLQVRVVDTRSWDSNLLAVPTPVTVGERITDPAADLAKLGTGHVLDFKNHARINPFIYDASKLEGLAARDIYDMEAMNADSSSLVVVNKARLPGPVITVNEHPGVPDRELPIIVWYDDPRRNDTLLWPNIARIYKPAWPAAHTVPQIVIASQFGSDGKSRNNQDQQTAPATATAPAATTYDPSRLQAVQIYHQPDSEAPGYNPNEEHALVAPSLRFADVSPRPPAIYALRNGDLNYANRNVTSGVATYTSHPFVLVQYYDAAIDEIRMKAYSIRSESGTGDIPSYRFANNFSANPITLKSQPFVTMRAGEPVNPFYPLGVAIGASPAPETFGNNFFTQEAYWEDWRGSYWAISGGDKAWFNVSFYYPLAPDFWWPPTVKTPPVKVVKSGATYTATYDAAGTAKVPGTGESVAFLPSGVTVAPSENTLSSHLPTRVIYKSEWPENPAVLKAGETLTFSGGEYRADNPTQTIFRDGVPRVVQTPGLPQLLAFASAEVVFDSLNPDAVPGNLKSHWTARVVQALDKRTAGLPVTSFPAELQPASGRTTVKEGKYIFNELPASLQKRLRYDPLALRAVTTAGVTTQVAGVLEFSGLLNDKAIGDASLTASPPAVYVLEPNILTAEERDAILALVGPTDPIVRNNWVNAVNALYAATRNPETVPGTAGEYLTGLMRLPLFGENGQILKDNLGNVEYADPVAPTPMRAYGPGLALVPNGNFLNPDGTLADGSAYPDESWVTVVENNDPAFGGSPITPHIVKVDRTQRYRGAVKTILSDNVFDENIVLRSTGDFGANADDLVFEWWYRPDDGSLNVPPPDLIPAGQPNPWKLFPDPSGKAGKGRYQITLKGNPNAPEALLADTWWFARYRHEKDVASGTNWKGAQKDGRKGVNFTWAGAGNSQPFVDADLDGYPDFRAQLAQGWIKRVLDAVNPYEARIRDFEGDSPSTLSSMVAQFGARYEGPVALNPDKNVIENVGLIELYQTILNRGRSLSVDLSQPVSTPAISNALQLASTRISDFYSLLANEAYVDALDPTIGHGSDSVDYGSLSTSVFAFQNQMSSQMEEELALLRGVDDFFARPVYNRLFWNFTKGEGEAAYATNYDLTDINADGFIDEDDALMLFPQGHGDAWGHYLTAVRNQYELLRHPFFNWVSRAESYNLQDIVITVDFLDERKFAAAAAAKAKAAAEIVSLTYRDRYVADPKAQWQGYTDSNADRAWGVDEWARRSGQGAYFDWVTANALLPSEHPNTTLEGIRKVDRQTNSDIAVVSANLNAIQNTMDQADRGYNPLGLTRGAQAFDIDPLFEYFGEYGAGTLGKMHFDQIHERATKMFEAAQTVWNRANESSQMLRKIGNTEAEFRNSTFQEDLAYRNRLIQIFGKPYEGTVGPGRLYPAGYEGPDLGLYMYVPVRQINKDTVPGPSVTYADFKDITPTGTDTTGAIKSGTLFDAYNAMNSTANAQNINAETIRNVFSSTFGSASNSLTYGGSAGGGLFDVNYTDLLKPKVELDGLVQKLPVTAAGYTFQAPPEWGGRAATGELQNVINQMIQQEAEVAKAIAAWDALSGEVVRILRLIDSRLVTSNTNQGRDEAFGRAKYVINGILAALDTTVEIINSAKETSFALKDAIGKSVPKNLPTAGLSFSPGDALSAVVGATEFSYVVVSAGFNGIDDSLKIAKTIAQISLDVAETELNLAKAEDSRKLEIREWLKEVEDKVGDESILRIAVFKEIQALRELSDRYRTLIDEGARVVDERAAFNKRVAAATQRNRYQDMTFRVARNHALQTYRSSFDLASRYAYLAASAYDYETNYAISDPASPADAYQEIIRSRSLGSLEKEMTRLKQNYDSQRGQLGFNNLQRETGEISMRRELMRILPAPEEDEELPPGDTRELAWKEALQDARVPDLWQLSEFRNHCRPFAAATDAAGKRVPQPGIALRFSSDISTGKNFFGKPLSGGDQAYSTSNFATKIVGVGVAFEGYRTDSVSDDLAAAPRVYFVPVGMDIMRVSRTDDPDELRMWKVAEQAIPVPFPALGSQLQKSGYIPLLDGLNGRLGDARRFSDFRAYPGQPGEGVKDTRLIGRSIWNTEWILIIPGATLNASPEVGLDRFVDQVSDIKLIFDTYGQSGG